MHQSGAQALIQALMKQQVDVLFGYPGGAVIPIYDALFDHRDQIRHILVRHEQGAVHAAQGYARVSGKAGVCLATSGPGATNLITGLMDALMDSTPIVAITGQVNSSKLGKDAFQEADVIGLTLAATKWSHQVTSADDLAGAIEQAFEIALDGRPGPVLIDITRDAQVATATLPQAPNAFEATTVRAPLKSGTSEVVAHHPLGRTPNGADGRALDRSDLERSAQLINEARRPMLMIGQGVLLSRAQDEVQRLADTAGLPIASTLLGLSAIPNDHPLFVGMLGMHGSYAANRLTNEADVIVAVGMRFDDRVTGDTARYASNAKIVHIEIDPTEIDRQVPSEVALVADAGKALRALLPLVHSNRHDEWLAEFHRLQAEERTRVIEPMIRPPGGELTMAEVVDRLSQLTRGKALIISDVGQHQMMAARYYGFRYPSSHVTSGGLGTMGFGLPAACGAKVAAPDREVVAVVGDGGFQMNIQELGTLMQERLPVKIMVLDNAHLGMVRQWQELFFDRRYSFVEMQNPDFVALGRGYRIDGERVTEREELEAAILRMLASDGPYLLDVKVVRSDNVFPMVPAGSSVSEVRLS